MAIASLGRESIDSDVEKKNAAAGFLTGPVDEFKVILERYLIGASPTTISSSATTISSSTTATFGARASLINIKSSPLQLLVV